MSEPRRCATCRFWHADAGPAREEPEALHQCRRYPPQVNGDWGEAQAVVTLAGYWCGEWALHD